MRRHGVARTKCASIGGIRWKERERVSDHDWQAPGSAPDRASDADAAGTTPGTATPAGADPYGTPLYGAPDASAPAGYGPAPQGFPGAVPPGAPGWTPPPKPGLLPLRPMGFGTLLWAPFRTLRRNPAPTFGSGLLVQFVSVLASAAVFVPFFLWALPRLENTSGEDLDAVVSGTIGGFLALMLVPVAISVVAAAFLQGVMVVEVASGTLGEKLGFGALWRRAAARIWPLIGWTLLVAAAILVAFAVIVLIIVLAAAASPAALAIGIAIAVLLGLGLIGLGVWIGVKLALVPSVIVLERAGIATAVRRSWRLTDGAFWRTFGILLLVGVILNIASQVVVQPVSLVGTILAVVIDPTGTGSAITITVITSIVTVVLSLLIGAITAVVQAALVAVIYIDLRMRREGLDLELERHVEQRDAGRDVDDPYRPPAPAASQVATPGAGSEPTTWS